MHVESMPHGKLSANGKETELAVGGLSFTNEEPLTLGPMLHLS